MCSVSTEEHLQPFKENMEVFVSEGERGKGILRLSEV